MQINNEDSINHRLILDKKLFVICHSYNSFQKESIEALSQHFREITVFVRTNPFAEISNYFSIPQLENFKLSNKIDLSSKIPNVNITPTPIWYLPGNYFYKTLGKRHFDAVEKMIKHLHQTFDLIQSHFTWSAGYVGARLKEMYDTPFVVTAHGYDIYSLPFIDQEWRANIEYVLNTADHIITVSQSNLACIKKMHVTTPVTVIPNGFRRDIFNIRNSLESRKLLNLPSDKKIILTVGNLEPIKGHKYLIEAIKTITNERKDILCLIIGEGKLHTSLGHQIHSLGLEKFVKLLGRKPHNEIPLWMNACDLFVLPSLNEGNPTVMFEALGCGKPFVGAKVGGVPETITSDTYGLLVEPANPDDLSEAILLALNREWNREAILVYAKQFTWENIANQIIRVYKKIG